jgi:hypothetical protein
MTIYAARTPKYGKRVGKSDGATSFSNRVFGLHLYCGPIQGEILIHTDDLVRGGANFMIEVQRRGNHTHTSTSTSTSTYIHKHTRTEWFSGLWVYSG